MTPLAYEAPQLSTGGWWILALSLTALFLVTLAHVIPQGPRDTHVPDQWPERAVAPPVGDFTGYDEHGEPVFAQDHDTLT